MSACTHRWRSVYEAFLLGGSFLIGWECVDCEEYVSQQEMKPIGVGGVVLAKAARLIAPHGGNGRTGSGQPYHEQIISEDGVLTIIPPRVSK